MSNSPKSAIETSSAATTVAILGCGSLGTALLCGVLASIEESKQPNPTRPNYDGFVVPSKFIACVRGATSASRVKAALAPYNAEVAIYHGKESAPLHEADIIVLSCQPQDLRSCLGTTTIRSQLHGKLLISLLAGVTIPDIESALYSAGDNGYRAATIVRAMPNTASFVRESITVIQAPGGTSIKHLHAVDWLFESIGKVKHIIVSDYDTCTALCASTPAFFAVLLESLIDGAVALGLSRDAATFMAAQSMKGCAALVLAGEQPISVKEKITTPGGSTIRGLLALERGNVRSVFSGALIECKEAAEGLRSKVTK